MKSIDLRSLLAATLLAAGLPPARSASAATPGGPPIATKAPAAAVQALDGRTVQLSAVAAGKPTMLIFWASWCPSCRQQLPSFKAAYERYRGTALQIVAVNVGIRDTPESVGRYVKENGVPYPVLFDTNHEALVSYRVSGTPTILLLNAAGEIVLRDSAVDPNVVDALLAGKPIPRREAPREMPAGSRSR